MKWSILILTLPRRREMFQRLLAVLLPQVRGSNGKVQLLTLTPDPALPVGENRELLRRAAEGEYISFIDDDDLVPENFVARILPLLDGVDYIGFNLEQTMDGKFACIEKRSLRYPGVGRECEVTGKGRYRDLSHVNPMRRELALLVPMSGWPGEDTRWADELRKLNVVKTEHYLDETLYFYLTRTIKPELEAV